MKRIVLFKLINSRSSKIEEGLEISRVLYNLALEQRITTWNQQRKTLSFYNQCKDFTVFRREFPEKFPLPVTCYRLTALKRVHENFQRFFRQKKGFPRFKGKGRFSTLVFDRTGWKIRGNKLIIPTLGRFTIRGNNPYPQGKFLGIRLIKKPSGWWLHLILEIGKSPAVKPTKKIVGIDVGLKKFAFLSDGSSVNNPRFLRKSEKKLVELQRILSRKKKGSNARKRAKESVARFHEKIANQRKEFCHQVSRNLVNNYKGFALEKLNVKGMVEGEKSDKRINKSIMDAAWGQFARYLTYKAEGAGKPVVFVNPRGTTQLCSGCGNKVPKTLRDRVHECSACGLIMDRDLNAALNIRNRAVGAEALV